MADSIFSDAPEWMVKKMIDEGGGISKGPDGVYHYKAPGEDPLFELAGAFAMGLIAEPAHNLHKVLQKASLRVSFILFGIIMALAVGGLVAKGAGWSGYNPAAMLAVWTIFLPALIGNGFTMKKEGEAHGAFLDSVNENLDAANAKAELARGATVN